MNGFLPRSSAFLGGTRTAGVGAAGLTAAQWSVLRYFSRANSFSRTVSGFADFHATTRGTASQTVKGLVKSGYLGRSRSSLDGRSTRLDLTERAQAALCEDPLNDVVEAVGQLSPRERAEVASGLFRVLARLAERRGGKEFGSCATCGHLKRSEDGDTFPVPLLRCRCRAGRPGAVLLALHAGRLTRGLAGSPPRSCAQNEAQKDSLLVAIRNHFVIPVWSR